MSRLKELERRMVSMSVIAIAIAAAGGCGGGNKTSNEASDGAAPSVVVGKPSAALAYQDVPMGREVTVEHLSFQPPQAWPHTEPRSAMRKAQYAMPGSGGRADGEVVLYFFGVGQGGSTEANITRWVNQFESPTGENIHDDVKRFEFSVGDLKVTKIGLVGTMLPSRMPGSTEEAKRPGWAMLAAVVEGHNGPWFFKATGPAETLAENEAGFEALLYSLKL